VSEIVEVDESVLNLMKPGEIIAVTMGWLWSVHGFLIIGMCFVGIGVAPREIYRGIDNAPITVNMESVTAASSGRNVRIFGRIVPGESFSAKSWKREYSISVLADSGRRVLVYPRGVLTTQESSAPSERWFEGEPRKLSAHSNAKIDASDISVKAKMAGIDIPDEISVIADAVIPHF